MIKTNKDFDLLDGTMTIHGFLEVKNNPDKLHILATSSIEILDNSQNPYGLIAWGNNSERKPYWCKTTMTIIKIFQMLGGQGNLKNIKQLKFGNNPFIYQNKKMENRKFIPIKIINPINNLTGQPLNLQIMQSIFPNSNSIAYLKSEYPDELEYQKKYNEYIENNKKKIYVKDENGIKTLVDVYTHHENKKCSIFEEIIMVSGIPCHKFINWEVPSFIKPNYYEINQTDIGRTLSRELVADNNSRD